MNERRINHMIVVSRDGSGDCTTVNEAVRYWQKLYEENGKTVYPGFGIIYIKNGCYEERVKIRVPHLTLIGEDPQNTILTWHHYAYMPHCDGMKRGTFRSYSVFIHADDIIMRNLTIENSSGTGPEIGQAVALYADGDRLVFDNCRFLGCTDTLFTGPLPPEVIKKDGFVGPLEFAPRVNGRHWYYGCYVEGDVDFIFGSATAFFEQCEIYSKSRGLPVNGYVTAASTVRGQAYGYVFDSCRFTGDCPPQTVYLGRPWRNDAKTVILHSWLGAHIHEEGWNDWEKAEARSTSYYGEYGNDGPGADIRSRPGWIHRLTQEEAALYTRGKVLGGRDGWHPQVQCGEKEIGGYHNGTKEE